jgi:uncharacterized alkaline shock family protein YloU
VKNGDKILLVLYLIVTTCLFGVFLVLPWGYLSDDLIKSVLQGILFDYKWYYFAAALVLIIVNIRLFIAVISGNRTRNFGIIRSTENGEVNISYETIKSLVMKTISSVKGAKDTKVFIYPGQESIKIMIKTYIMSDINIPQTVKEIQENVKRYVEAIAEVPVGEVKVSIIDVAPVSKLRLE